MKLLVLYRPNSEHASAVERFTAELERRSIGDKLEMCDVDSRDGVAKVTAYDIVQYPAILALDNDGHLLNGWYGTEFPLLDEVMAYVHG